MAFSLSFLLAIILLPYSSSARFFPNLFPNHAHNHHQLIKRAIALPTNSSLHSLHKRSDSFSGKATFYDAGLGACGDTNTNEDFIVALNQPQYTSGSWCHKTITIHQGKTSAKAKIQDECPGCPFGGLDMTPALFNVFAKPEAGIFYMTWSLDDGSSDSNPPPAPAPVAKKPDPQPSTDSPTVKTGTSNNSSQPQAPPPQPKSDPNPPSVVAYNASIASGSFNPNTITQVSTNTTSNGNKNNNSSQPPAVAATLNATTTPTGITTGTVQFFGKSPNTDPYAPGGNLDTISQLVISFGSLTAASASHAINPQS